MLNNRYLSARMADTYPLPYGPGMHESVFSGAFLKEHGVAAIPPSAFYPVHPEAGRTIARFAFCKTMETLERAAERLGRIRP